MSRITKYSTVLVVREEITGVPDTQAAQSVPVDCKPSPPIPSAKLDRYLLVRDETDHNSMLTN